MMQSDRKMVWRCIGYPTMTLAKLLLIVIDILLALMAAYLLFPSLMGAANTVPIALAALFGAGIMLAIYGD